MKMKKLFTVALSAMLATTAFAGLTACGNDGDSSGNKVENQAPDVKVGLICLHDKNSTYDKNFLDGMDRAIAELGMNAKAQLFVKTGIDESEACYEAAADLMDTGCNVIFADSFGHESFMLKAAKEFKNVKFCHATGTMAHTENLDNFSNAFASIYEGRYLAGVAAGLKLKEMEEAGKLKETNKDENGNIKIGYIGAFTYAEVMSGYTSFYLGAKSVVSNLKMEVTFTGSWYDEAAEKASAEKLIDRGCALISQHADSWGAPSACEAAGVPNVSYNGSTASKCPNTAIISSAINWTPYFKYMIAQTQKGEKIDADWCGGLGTEVYDGTKALLDGSVVISELGKNAAAGTAAKLEEVRKALRDGTTKVFDINTFTVAGKKLENYMANVNTNDDPSPSQVNPDTQVVANGAFEESKYRSAPYFDVEIDGIVLLDRNYGG